MYITLKTRIKNFVFWKSKSARQLFSEVFSDEKKKQKSNTSNLRDMHVPELNNVSHFVAYVAPKVFEIDSTKRCGGEVPSIFNLVYTYWSPNV